MKRGRKHRKTKQSTGPQEMKQERELSPPPSPPACGWNCIPKMSLFRKKGRKQERQKEEEQLRQLQTERREMELTNKETTQKRKKERQTKKMEQQNDEIRDLEEAVRLLDEEIQAFRERKKELKRELNTLKKKIAGVEMKTAKIRQTKREWKREMEAMKERMVQEEKQREEKRTGQRDYICKEIVINVVKTDREMEEKKEKREDKKMAAVDEKQDVITERKSEEELLEEMEKQREEERLKERRGSQEAIETGKEVMIEMENLQMEPAAPSTSRNNVVQRVLSSVLSSVHAGVQSIMEFRKKFSAQPVEVEEEEVKVKSPPRPLVPLGAPTGVLTIHIRSCRDFRKNTHVQEDTQCMVKITVGRTVKCSRLQPFEENLIFNEVKHFSIQIQKEEALGVQLSSSVKVDLISFDGDSPVPKLMGSTTIGLKEVLNQKSSVDQQTDLRLGSKKVCKLDAGLTFTYGSFGYGYSHQMKHPGRKMDKLVEESLFLRCPPPEDRRDPHYNVVTPCTSSSVSIMSSCSAQCRVSTGIINCMDRRGRLSQLNKALENCETGEDRVQLLEGLILKTRPRTSSPCTMNQTPEIRSKEAEERRREANITEHKVTSLRPTAGESPQASDTAAQPDFQSPAQMVCPVSSSAGIAQPALALISNSTILFPSTQHSTHLHLSQQSIAILMFNFVSVDSSSFFFVLAVFRWIFLICLPTSDLTSVCAHDDEYWQPH
ncbi:hypothetical protein MHYP_G00290330 [Metynnis hypsauchen]